MKKYHSDPVTLPSGLKVSALWLVRVGSGFATTEDIRVLMMMDYRDVNYIVEEWLETGGLAL
jgi:hypothetical protein